ncbi:uncharacterized protein NEMAJ01_0962 [Nematocida major]|uniref:uncharacterized protein n=1 Tax=Nematocida major TaxID=1912982 RepID=UPI00200831F1|nr:uncharacterized protein NEMAJ01_0962 [Nematocida major]KAH9386066.1 hypothetical protein NEMAJ01_0962 [Nematocida major]
MIESIALRKFAVSYFLVHPTKPLCNLVNRITTTIRNRFFKGEIVFLKSKELTGRIVETTKTGYIVEIYDDSPSPQKEEVKAENLLRKDSATKNEVLGFILSVTRDTPLGRIVANNIIQELGVFKGQKPLKSMDKQGSMYKADEPFVQPEKKEVCQAPDPLAEEKERALEELEEKRVEDISKEILKIPAEKWQSPINTYEANRRILSVYASLSAFSDFLKVKAFTLDDFVGALFCPEKTTRILVEVYSKLLKAISHERRKTGKEGLRDMIQVASNITYDNPALPALGNMMEVSEMKEDTGFTRVQWFAGDATSKTLQSYMKSFVYDVLTVYSIKVGTNEFMPGCEKVQSPESLAIDRLLMLSFLMETVVLGMRFRGYYDTAVNEYKDKEKERVPVAHELKRLHGEALVTESAQDMKTVIEKTEKTLKGYNNACKPEIIRSKIYKYADITFLYIGGRLFYEHKKAFYMIDEANWSGFIALFNPDKRKDGGLVENVKKFLRVI